MILSFDTDRLPRSMTRDEWLKIYRWKRQTEKTLKEAVAKRMYNLALYGTSHPEMFRGVADELVNPPILVYP